MIKHVQAGTLFFIVFLLLCINSSAHGEETKNILVLHSYHEGFKWTDNITSGIQSVVNASPDNIEVYYEYLDTKRYSTFFFQNQMESLFASKYPMGFFDVLIAVDNNALRFVQVFGKNLFQETPVVFCGINNFRPELIEGIKQITGVTETTDYRKTIELIEMLHPNVKNIVVILDKTDTGKEIKQEFKSVMDHFRGRFTFELYQNYLPGEIIQKVSTLSDDDIIYLLIFFRDSENNYISQSSSLSRLSIASHRPVYGSWDFLLGEGILGGVINSGIVQGKTAAEMAVRILKGEKASDIPIKDSIINNTVFDYNQMERFGLKSSQLPEGATIINSPQPFYDAHKEFITIALSIALLVTIIFLLNFRVQKQKQQMLVTLNESLDNHVKEKTVELREAREKLNKIINTAPSPVYYQESDGRFGDFNDAFADMVIGLPREQLIGRTLFDIPDRITTKKADFYYAKDLELLNDPGTQFFEAKIKCADNVHRDFFFNKATITDSEGNIAGIVGIMIDITARKKIERDLVESRERFKTLLDASFGGIIIHEEGKIIDVNQGLADITGYTVGELKKLNGFDLIAPEYRIDVAKKVLAEDEGVYDVEGIKKDGSTYPLELQAKMIPYNGRIIRATGLRDVSDKRNAEIEKERLIQELQESNAKLEKLSITDPLTRLHNRRYIFERLSLEMTKANRYMQSLSIILVDIDEFKQLNDTYGHLFGDIVLQKTGRVFHDTIREIDMVGRYGGEEFLFVLPNTGIDQAILLAERIRKNIEETIWDEKKLIITLSGGVVQYGGELRNEYLKKADDLLYKAKSSGKNRIETSFPPEENKDV